MTVSKRKKVFFPAVLFLTVGLLLPAAGSANLIRFNDFDWGMSLYGVELQAAGADYRLEEKNADSPDLGLKFSGEVFGDECEIEFSFTPLGQKLYSVRLTWEGNIQGNFILRELLRRYGDPRQEIPAASIHIWTRKFTELELRYDRDITVLTYSNLNLWNDFKEETELIAEREEENNETE